MQKQNWTAKQGLKTGSMTEIVVDNLIMVVFPWINIFLHFPLKSMIYIQHDYI